VKLIIGNRNYSSWSLRAWLLLKENRLPFEEVRIPLDQPSTRRRLAEYTAAAKVPVLQDGELTVWDSLAICEYVSEQYLAGRGWPLALKARAQARAISAEMHSGFAEIRTRLPMNCRAQGRRVASTEGLEAEIARVDAIWSRCRQSYGEAGPGLFGTFSIADCMFAPMAFRFRTYGIALSKAASAYRDFVLDHASLRDWEARAREEPETIAAEEVGLIS